MIKIKINKKNYKIISKVTDHDYINDIKCIFKDFYKMGYVNMRGEKITEECELVQYIYDVINNNIKGVKVHMNKETKRVIIDILVNPYSKVIDTDTITIDDLIQAVKDGIVTKLK